MLTFRVADPADAKRLFEWRNDELTCAMSRSADPVSWDQHVAWLAKRLDRDQPHLYIAEIDGDPVGTFRVDGDEISYTVAPEHRRKGISKAMLRMARQIFGPLKAEIYPRNVASIKAARAAGFEIVLLNNETSSSS